MTNISPQTRERNTDQPWVDHWPMWDEPLSKIPAPVDVNAATAGAQVQHRFPDRRATSMSIPFHPLAETFPLLKGAAFDELVVDIKANGLRELITVYQNKILDGRNRFRACLAAGIDPGRHLIPFTGDEKGALAFVVSKNVYRRQLRGMGFFKLCRRQSRPRPRQLRTARVGPQRNAAAEIGTNTGELSRIVQLPRLERVSGISQGGRGGPFRRIVESSEGHPARKGTPRPRISTQLTRLLTMTKPDMQAEPEGEKVIPIAKPKEGGLARFKSKAAPTIANVATKTGMLPLSSISEAGDFVRVHPNETDYWSSELCFVKVPTKGTKNDVLHLIDEDLAMTYLEAKQILRFRLALASKPGDKFFLCHVPTQNLENTWNASAVEAIEDAKRLWVKAVSRRPEGVDAYKIMYARDEDAFSEPQWPSEPLDDLIMATFKGHAIDAEEHPGLLRLIGAKVIS